MVEIRVELFKSIQSTGLLYIDDWVMTYLSYGPACHDGLIWTTPHLSRNESLEHG